jgi:hypothetical protein
MVVAISKVQFRLQANSCTAATATRLTSMSRRATSARFWPIVSRRSLISNLRNEPSCKGGALRKLEVDFGGCYALSFSTVNRFRSTVHALALSGRPVCDHTHTRRPGPTTCPKNAVTRHWCRFGGISVPSTSLQLRDKPYKSILPRDGQKPIGCRQVIVAAGPVLPDNSISWMKALSRPGGSFNELPAL